MLFKLCVYLPIVLRLKFFFFSFYGNDKNKILNDRMPYNNTTVFRYTNGRNSRNISLREIIIISSINRIVVTLYIPHKDHKPADKSDVILDRIVPNLPTLSARRLLLFIS